MKIFRKIVLLCFLLISALTVLAQNTTADAKMADTMRSNGRIYVVVAVVLTILLGLLLYVYRLDRKIAKLEKENR